MPGLTIATDGRPASATTPRGATANPRRASRTSSRASSPSRPPISPITPTLAPAQLPAAGPADPATATTHSTIPNFALARPTFTHETQTDQVAMAPPPTQPIDFDSNPDVLALKSAISILQLQRARATADIQSLSRARDAALARPATFAADLEAGRVRVEGDALFGGARAARAAATAAAADDSPSSSDSDSDSESEDDDDDDPARQEETPESETKADGGGGDGDTLMTDTPPMAADGPLNPPPPPTTATAPTPKPKRKKGKQKPTTPSTAPAPAPWQTLPKPQNIVRCPPINWAQYGIVGESLDKLHAEQVAAPTPGAPMVLGPGGTYEFKAGGAADQGSSAAGGGGEQPRRLVGVAAPYNPMRDKVEKKGKGGKR